MSTQMVDNGVTAASRCGNKICRPLLVPADRQQRQRDRGRSPVGLSNDADTVRFTVRDVKRVVGHEDESQGRELSRPR
jgi:hypothetical protein